MQPGMRVGQYEVLEKIGAGGMGEVFRARDTRLGREVALKQLPSEVSRNPERVARFEREARTLAALQHPNIASLYGFEEAGGERFLVMEIVEGEDLSERLRHGGLGVAEALRLAIQIASGMEEAHAKGIVHRDLKPANVKISQSGEAKILDFGLARARAEDSGSQPDLSHSPTFTAGMTVPGLVLGTAAYMSPEQARGRPVDRTADIWAFGVVLFEMLTGQQLFRGETVSDVMAAILKTDPDWTELPAGTPARLREVLEGCLVKDPRQRRRDIGDVRQDLERIASGKTADVATTTPGRRWLLPVGLAVVGLLGILLGAGLIGAFSGATPDSTASAGLVKLSVTFPRDFSPSPDATPGLSPDGGTVLMGGRPKRTTRTVDEPERLYRRRLDDYAFEPVIGSEGVVSTVFSPDGRWLAMLVPISPNSTRLQLIKAPLDGSTPPVALLDWPEAWDNLAVWLPDGDLIARVGQTEIVRIPTDGGAPGKPLGLKHEGHLAEVSYPWPGTHILLPDGRHLLGSLQSWSTAGWAEHVVTVDLETGEVRILVENGDAARWWKTGHLLFSRGNTLLAIPFEPARRSTTGGPLAVADGLRTALTWNNGSFSLSTNGTLAHIPGGYVGGRQQLVWMDGSLNEIGPWSEERQAFDRGPLISPDGRRLAMVIAGSDGLYDIWTSEVARPSLTRLLEVPGADCDAAVWSFDGERLATLIRFRSSAEISIVRADGSGDPERLLEMSSAAQVYFPNAFTPTGDRLILTRMEAGRFDLMTLPASPSPSGKPLEPALLLKDASFSKLSPDGRWLAYASANTGRNEIYVRRLEADLSLGPQLRVSMDGGDDHLWYTRGPGKPLEIRYISDRKIFTVTLTTAPEVRPSKPILLADTEEHPRWQQPGSLPDGRILMRMAGEEEAPPTSFDVVLNWGAELSRRLAASRTGP